MVNGETEQLTIRGKYDNDSTLGQRAFLAKRTFPGGTLVLFLTVVDVVQSDEGKYSCKVYTWIDETYKDVAQDSITMEIYTFPGKIFPSCESAPNTLKLRTGNRLVLTCSSDKGFPFIQLNWRCINCNAPISVRDSQIDDNTVASEIVLTLDASYNRAIFECKMTSAGFPERERSCTVGPLTIVQDLNGRGNELSTQTVSKVVESNGMQDISKDKICNTACETEDKYTLLYWAVAAVGTTILMLIFLTTTIIYCCKYNTMSAEVITAQNSFTSCDGAEPVYVSLQRRQPPEQNSMFMSVEDPNNSGNKVLMPREVFDEFYRSLSLKKRESNQVSIYD